MSAMPRLRTREPQQALALAATSVRVDGRKPLTAKLGSVQRRVSPHTLPVLIKQGAHRIPDNESRLLKDKSRTPASTATKALRARSELKRVSLV